MDNILITFTSDTGGLDEASQKMQQLTEKEKALAAEMQDVANKSTGDPYNSKGAKTATDAVTNETKAINDNRKSIDQLAQAQKGAEMAPAVDAAAQSFRMLYKETMNQIKTMRVNGQTTGEYAAQYDALVEKAGQLSKIQSGVVKEVAAAGSNSKSFEAMASGINLATGAYTALEGAQQLFGSNDKDMQEQMVKLQSAMAISMGLTQALNELQKESAIMKAVETLQTRALATATTLSTSTTKGATIAQAAFNLVAKANPYVLLAMLLITVVGALMLFSSGTKKAVEAQESINDSVKAGIDALKEESDQYKANAKEKTDALQHEIDLIAARGGSEAEQAAARKKLAEQQLADANVLAGRNADEIKNIDANKKAVEDLTEYVANLNATKAYGAKSVMFDIRGNNVLVKTDIDDALKLAQGQLDNKKAQLQLGVDSQDAVTKAKGAVDILQNDTLKAARDKAKLAMVAEAEDRLLLTKKESADELTAQIELINKKKTVDLMNVELTQAERKKIIDQADKDIQQAENNYRITSLNAEKNVIDAKLAATIAGSQSEFDLKKEELTKQRDIDLSEFQITESKKALINANYEKSMYELSKEYTVKRAESETNAQISIIQANLSSAQIGSKQELDLKDELIQKKMESDIFAAQQSITNEKELAAKVTEIQSAAERERLNNHQQYDSDMIAFDEQMYQYQLDANLNAYKLQHKNQTDFSEQEYQNKMAYLNKESSDLEAQYIGRSKDDKNYQAQRAAIDKDISDTTVDYAKSTKERTKLIYDDLTSALFDSLSSISSSLFSSRDSAMQQQIDDFQHYYTTDATAAAQNSQLKLVTQQQYDAKMLEMKRQQAQQQKDEAMFTATLNEAQAITGIWAGVAKYGPAGIPMGAILTALMLATFAVQIHAIENEPLPKYAKGRRGGKAEIAEVSEAGGELVYFPTRTHVQLTAGASVIPASKSSQIMAALDGYNMPIPRISQIALSDAKQNMTTRDINYDLLAAKIGLEMKQNIRIPASPQRPVSVHVDHGGTTITEGNATTRYLNKRFGANV